MKKYISFLIICMITLSSAYAIPVSAISYDRSISKETQAPKLKNVRYNYKNKRVFVTVYTDRWKTVRAKLKGSKKFQYKSLSSVKKPVTFSFKIQKSKDIIVQDKADNNKKWSKKLIVKRNQYVSKKPKLFKQGSTEPNKNGKAYIYGKGKAQKKAYVKVYYRGKIVRHIKTKSGYFSYKIKVTPKNGKHVTVSAKVKNKKRSAKVEGDSFIWFVDRDMN